DKLLKRGDAGLTDSALIFSWDDPGLVPQRRLGRMISLNDSGCGLVGNHDHIEAGTQAACSQVLIVDILERKLVPLEQPPRETFVHIRDPTFVKTYPARL